MTRPTLARRFGQTLAIAAFLAYSLAGLAGYGLHALTDGADHSLAAHAGHEDYEHSASGSIAAAHDDCSICNFLAQAQSSHVPQVTLGEAEPLCEALPTADSLVLALIASAAHARGPPAV
jgi:hypothetical protein